MSAPQEWSTGGEGFGLPPSGGGSEQPRGGGGLPPGGGSPPGSGEAPLGRIPFGPEEERHIAQTARFMKIAAVLAIASVFLSLIGLVAMIGLVGCQPHEFWQRVGESFCAGVPVVLVFAVFGVLLWRSSNAVQAIVSTDGDRTHFFAGLRSLRTYFLFKGIVVVTLLLLPTCGVVLFFVIFGIGLELMSGRH